MGVGWLQADFDDPPDIESAREILIRIAYVQAVFLSPSGLGLKAVVRVPVCRDEAEHKRAFHAAEVLFRGHGLKMDPAPKNPTALCYVSHDPDAFWREEEAEELPFLAEDETLDTSDRSKAKGLRQGGERKRAIGDRVWTAEEVAGMLGSIPRQSYPEWLQIASGVWDELGEFEGTAVLKVAWPEEKRDEYERKFPDRLSDFTIATVIDVAKRNGWESPPFTPDPILRAQFADFFHEAREAERLMQAEELPEPRGFTITRADEIKGCAEPADFVEELLTQGGVSVAYGPSNCGKSFWILDLAAAVATGRPFRGELEVDQGAVVYVALEGETGVRNRIAALRKSGRLAKGAPFFLCFAPVSLRESGHPEKLAESINQAAEQSGLPCRLVILDTLARAMAGGDENKGQDMTDAVRSIDAIRAATGAHVCLIHHCGKDEAKGARGHSSLRAAVDTEIEISPIKDTPWKVATVTKQRDLVARESMPFCLEVVTLGVGRRGKPITSCVVVHEEPNAETLGRKAGRPKKSDDAALLALLPQKSTTAWKNSAKAQIGMGDSTFFRIRKRLETSGKATQNEKTGWERAWGILE
jgi:hypothetical protein